METIFFSSFLDTVAATHDKNRFERSLVHTYATRHDTMRHDAFFRSPYNQMDQFTHMQHDRVWSSRQKAAATQITLEAIFVVCRSDSIKKTAKENSFHRNLTWVYKFMTQEYSLKSQKLQFNVTAVTVLLCHLPSQVI